MVWTSPRTWVSGEVVTAALLNTHLRDNLKAISDAWTAYTPALTATTTNPTLGTGSSATGRWVNAGKLVIAQYRIAFGTSGTAAGSGTYLVSLPFAPSTAWSNRHIGSGVAFDVSANAMQPLVLRVNGTASTMVLQFPATWPGGTVASVTHTNLFPWAASDELHGEIVYEAA